jgi:hypothetical protein
MNKLKKIICKLFGHKWFRHEGLGLVPIMHEVCERCYKLNVWFPLPKTFNCRCSFVLYKFMV